MKAYKVSVILFLPLFNKFEELRVRVVVLNATFKNNSVISSRPVLLVEKIAVHAESHPPVTRHKQTLSHNVISSTPRLSGIWIHNALSWWISENWAEPKYSWRVSRSLSLIRHASCDCYSQDVYDSSRNSHLCCSMRRDFTPPP
jgi:hypothetical protein